MANDNKNMKHSVSQCQMIAAHLEDGHSIGRLEALQLFGCFELSARICELRNRGMFISSRNIVTPSGKHGVEYFIPQDKLPSRNMAHTK